MTTQMLCNTRIRGTRHRCRLAEDHVGPCLPTPAIREQTRQRTMIEGMIVVLDPAPKRGIDSFPAYQLNLVVDPLRGPTRGTANG